MTWAAVEAGRWCRGTGAVHPVLCCISSCAAGIRCRVLGTLWWGCICFTAGLEAAPGNKLPPGQRNKRGKTAASFVGVEMEPWWSYSLTIGSLQYSQYFTIPEIEVSSEDRDCFLLPTVVLSPCLSGQKGQNEWVWRIWDFMIVKHSGTHTFILFTSGCPTLASLLTDHNPLIPQCCILQSHLRPFSREILLRAQALRSSWAQFIFF